MMVKMLELSKADQLGFRSAAWDFTNLGKCDGFCEQEIAMANLTKTRYYILSSGLKVVRAFAKCNFLFYNEEDINLRISLLGPPLLCWCWKSFRYSL